MIPEQLSVLMLWFPHVPYRKKINKKKSPLQTDEMQYSEPLRGCYCCKECVGA